MRSKKPIIRQRILEFFVRERMTTIRGLSKALNINRATAKIHLNELAEKQVVDKHKLANSYVFVRREIVGEVK